MSLHTTATEQPEAEQNAQPSAVPTVKELLKKRSTLIIGIAVSLILIIALTAISMAMLQPKTSPRMDPDSYEPAGSSAVANILHNQGVTIQQVYTADDLVKQLGQTPNATVLLSDPEGLLYGVPQFRLDQIHDAVPAGQLVLAGISPKALETLAPGLTHGIESVPEDQQKVGSTCQWPMAEEAEEIYSRWDSLALEDDDSGYLCFTNEDESVGLLAVSAAGTMAFAEMATFSNDKIQEQGNAVMAFSALGRNDHLLWYTPTSPDLMDPNSEAIPLSLPRPLQFGLAWAIIVGILMMIWRGRRHGPVVVEPLPVEVSGAETTVGRGRLYHRGRHQTHAMETLQQATVQRLASRLHLGTGATVPMVIRAVATTLGTDARHIEEVFAIHPGQSLQDFVSQAQQLKKLEDDVRLKISPDHPIDRSQEN